jgi:hypothetical protein
MIHSAIEDLLVKYDPSYNRTQLEGLEDITRIINRNGSIRLMTGDELSGVYYIDQEE